MKFKYSAIQEDNGVTESEIDAENVDEVLKYLGGHGLRPISIKRSSLSLGEKNITLFGGGITLTDQIFLSKYLALMLKIGTGLLQAINILIEDFEKPSMKNFLLEVKTNLEKGMPFNSTFLKYESVFSQFYINLVKAGEASGNLEKVFADLTSALGKEKALRDQIKSAMVYPIILLTAASGVLFFLVSFALPKISKVFLDSGFNPPTFSKVVFAVGAFFGVYGPWILGVTAVLVVSGIIAIKASPPAKKLIMNMIQDIPVVKDLIKKIALQRFASTLSSLIKAGIPLTKALEITAETVVSHEELRSILLRIGEEGLAKGLTVGDAFKREMFFPRTVANLIAISEKAGHMEEVLDTLADFYTSEIESSLKSLVSFLEPVMLLSIGVVIGVIALAIIIPIYQLTSQI